MYPLDTVLNYIKENNLINAGDTVICGLSGGADSCAMVSILNTLKETLGFSLICAHLHHGLRGQEADRDLAFAEAFADSLNIPFYFKKSDVAKKAKEEKLSLEDAGRQERYAFFRELEEKLENTKIATAHNKEDNVETILMHMISGCGLGGLKGIAPIAFGNIIRPILPLSRQDIESYCKEKGISYVIDSTNLETDFTRNKIRLKILPLLKEINPSVTDAIGSLSASAKSACDFLDSIISDISIISDNNSSYVFLEEIRKMNSCLIERLILKMLECAGLSCRLSKKIIENIYTLIKSGKTTKSVDIGSGILARISYDKFIIEKGKKSSPFSYNLTEAEPLNIDGKKIFISYCPVENAIAVIPFEGKNNITVRSRKDGDKIRTGGMTKKLSDIYVNKKIDKTIRDTLIVIEYNGILLWAEKAGMADNCVSNEKYIVITWED